MRSSIVISPNEKEMECLYNQWLKKGVENGSNISAKDQRAAILLNGETIYIDYLMDGICEYDDDELIDVGIEKPFFFSVCYTTKEIMKYFLMNSVFSEGCYIDNDFGFIIPLKDLKEEDIIDFIEAPTSRFNKLSHEPAARVENG